MQKTSVKGKELLGRLEGCRLKAYRCEADVLTIGFGHTKGVYESQEITMETAYRFLASDLIVYERAVRKEFNKVIAQNKFDAWVMLAFNIGVGGFRSSTALRLSKSMGSNDSQVVLAIKRWKYVTINGEKRISKGLVFRRNAESCVYYSANYTKWV